MILITTIQARGSSLHVLNVCSEQDMELSFQNVLLMSSAKYKWWSNDTSLHLDSHEWWIWSQIPNMKHWGTEDQWTVRTMATVMAYTARDLHKQRGWDACCIMIHSHAIRFLYMIVIAPLSHLCDVVLACPGLTQDVLDVQQSLPLSVVKVNL